MCRAIYDGKSNGASMIFLKFCKNIQILRETSYLESRLLSFLLFLSLNVQLGHALAASDPCPNGCGGVIISGGGGGSGGPTGQPAKPGPTPKTKTDPRLAPSKQPCSGDPVSTADGTNYFSVSDFDYARVAPSFPLRFRRFYQNGFSSVAGELGEGWTHDYSTAFIFDEEKNEYIMLGSETGGKFYVDLTSADPSYLKAQEGLFASARLLPAGEIVNGQCRTNSSPPSLYTCNYGEDFVRNLLSTLNYNLPAEIAGLLERESYYGGLIYTDKFGKVTYFIALAPGAPNVFVPVLEVDRWGNRLSYEYESYIRHPGFSSYSTACNGEFCVPHIGGSNAIFDLRLQQVSSFPKGRDVADWQIQFEYKVSNSVRDDRYGYKITAVTNSLGERIGFSYLYSEQLSQYGPEIIFDSRPIISAIRSDGTSASYSYFSQDEPLLVAKKDSKAEPSGRNFSYAVESFSGVARGTTNVIDGNGNLTTEIGLPWSSIISKSYPYDVVTKDHLGRTTRIDTYGLQNQLPYSGNIIPIDAPLCLSSHIFLTSANSFIRRYGYNQDGLLVEELNDYTGIALLMSYDAKGNLIARQNTFNQGVGIPAESWTYDPLSRPLSYVDKNGRTTSYVYGDGLNLTEINRPLGWKNTFLYDPFGKLIESIDANGHRTKVSYDAAGHLQRSQGPDLSIPATQYIFDPKGRLESQTDALGATIRNTWTIDGLLASATLADGSSVVFTYDAMRNLINSKDANGTITQNFYDNSNNLIQVDSASNRPDAISQHFEYDPQRNCTAVIDGAGKRTSFTFNLQGLLASSSDPLGKGGDLRYDSNLKPIRKTDTRGVVRTYTYFGNGRLKKISFSGAPLSNPAQPVEFTYDGNGNRISMTDGMGTKTYSRDLLDRLTHIHDAARNFDINYTFDLVGNRTAMNYVIQGSLIDSFAYNFDVSDRMITVTETRTGMPSEVSDFTYNAINQISKVRYPNGVAEARYTYHPDNHRLIGQTNVNERGSALSQFDYSYDSAGNIKTAKDLAGLNIYSLDSKNQLLDSATSAATNNQSFTYDEAGNRVSLIESSGNTSYTINQGNEAVAVGGQTVTYDRAGNMFSKSGGAGSQYGWDSLNRLVKVESIIPIQTIATFQYDGDGIRSKKVNGAGSATNYFFDGLQVLAETDASGIIKKTYNPGISTTDDKGNKFYTLVNGHGDVANLIDRDGNIVDTYSYDAFGKTIGVAKNSNGFRYVGQYGVHSDDDLGLQYMWNRWYDSELGRFISRDPIGMAGGLNLYVYTGNNPVTYVDSLGLCADPNGPDPGFNGHSHWEGLLIVSDSNSSGDSGGGSVLGIISSIVSSPGNPNVRLGMIPFGFGSLGGVGFFRSSIPKLPFNNKVFGQLMKWGSNSATARAQIGNLSAEVLRKAGMTSNMAEEWAAFYRNESLLVPRNPSAAGRAELLEDVAKMLRQ